MSQTKIPFKKMEQPITRKIKKSAKKLRIVEPEKRAVTFTWCECGENHAGGFQEGTIVAPGKGFNLKDLQQGAENAAANWGCSCEIHDLKKGIEGVTIANKKNIPFKGEVNEAHLLIMRDLLTLILKQHGYTLKDLMKEVTSRKWDMQYFDRRRKRVLNKLARYNYMVSKKARASNYHEGGNVGTTYAFSEMPIMNIIRKEIGKLGEKFTLLIVAEGNLYPDGGVKKNGIGWHGDTERRMVFAMRFGLDPSMPFYYQWFHDAKAQGKRMEFPLNAGDMYVMSEWAVGTDWKKKSLVTLRHATGAAKYTAKKK